MKNSEPTELTQDELKKILSYDPDTGLFRRKTYSKHHKKGDIAGTKDKRGSYRIYIKGKLYRSSRLAFLYMNGKMPKKWLHTKKYCPNTEDSVNKGISYNKKWYVVLPYSEKTKKRQIYIGQYSDKHHAIMAKYAAEIINKVKDSKTREYALNYFSKKGYDQEQIKSYTEELIKGLIKGLKKRERIFNGGRRSVYCKQLDMSFESIAQAASFTCIDSPNIVSCCKGKLKSAGKHPETGEKLTWEYRNIP